MSVMTKWMLLLAGLALSSTLYPSYIAIKDYRNKELFRVRNEILYDPILGPKLYKVFPSFKEMRDSLCYWHLWTKKQWINYLNKEIENANPNS